MTRYGIVGDIHGNVAALRGLIAATAGQFDVLVFLGDYINRGPWSRQVLDELVRLRRTVSCTFLEGHHDIALRDFLRTGEIYPFLTIGGAATIRSYLTDYSGDLHRRMLGAVPSEHISFLESLERILVVEGQFAAAHEARQLTHYADQGYYTISGHSILHSGVPKINSHSALIDTGCGLPNGYLTCLSWPECEFIRVDSSGRPAL